MRLANMDYAGKPHTRAQSSDLLIFIRHLGANSLFIRVLLDKKHALPYKVVDALVFHFIRISNTYKAKKGDADKLPVLWHQSLLVFVQRYVTLPFSRVSFPRALP